MEDELQEVRDNFIVGNYEKAMNMSESIVPSNDMVQSENDAIFARCCLALGKIDKLKAMQNSENPGQKAAALMAVLTKSAKEQVRASAKEHLQKLAKDTQDVTATLLAAVATAQDGSYTEAVQMAQAHPTLEMQALCLFFCLMCNQVSMAEKMLRDMAGTNDDSAAYRLAAAAVKLATGDPEEGYLTYCDLAGQFPRVEGEEAGSVLLQTGKAVANMQRGMFTEAVDDLKLAEAVAPNDPDVLINLCACDINVAKKIDENFTEHYTKLVQAAPMHPYVVKSESISQVFARFKASNQA